MRNVLMSKEPPHVDVGGAGDDPRAAFGSPEAVLQSAHLTTEQKIDVLRRWEYDERELSVAVEEGMAGRDSNVLSRIRRALRDLSAGASAKSPPTKQGGA